MQIAKQTPKVRALTNSRKREFYLHPSGPQQQHCTASYWDGGSKSNYSVLNINTGAVSYPKTGSYPTFESKTALQPGEILIETGICQGKPATPAITFLESDREKVMAFLGNPEITREY